MTNKKRKMSKVGRPGYGGIYLDPDKIEYEEIDPPLRNLVCLVNSQPWISTYGCCAGRAHHAEGPGGEDLFFIGLFVRAGAGIGWLRSWVEEANRINGSTGLRTEMEYVHKHPFGQGPVDGWVAYRLTAKEIRKTQAPMQPPTYLRMIRSLEAAWARLYPKVAYLRRGKTRKSAPDVIARRLG